MKRILFSMSMVVAFCLLPSKAQAAEWIAQDDCFLWTFGDFYPINCFAGAEISGSGPGGFIFYAPGIWWTGSEYTSRGPSINQSMFTDCAFDNGPVFIWGVIVHNDLGAPPWDELIIYWSVDPHGTFNYYINQPWANRGTMGWWINAAGYSGTEWSSGEQMASNCGEIIPDFSVLY